MHRQFADRLLSLFTPVHRYGCTNHLCRHEAILWRNSALGQRPIVATAGFAGAAVAGALVMGLGLYFSSDEPTRAEVRGAYSGLTHREDLDGHAATSLSPVLSQLPEPSHETAMMLEVSKQADQLTLDLMPPLPTEAHSAAPAYEPAERGTAQGSADRE